MRFLSLTLLLILVTCVSSNAADELNGTGTPQILLNDILTPEGQLDTEAILNSGYEGSVAFPTLAPAADDDYWDTTLSPNLQGVEIDGPVFAMAVFDSKLIIGGRFTHAGGVSANNIAAWDGTTWTSLGQGTDSTVYALAVYEGDLYVGGAFDVAGGTVATDRLARWTGTQWETMIFSMGGGSVYALCVFNDDLIIGGDFVFTSNNETYNRIARWNDVLYWEPLSTGITWSVYPNSAVVNCLSVFSNQLVVGGQFSHAGGVSANHIARWSGSTWSSLGSGANGSMDYVECLTVYDGNLVAGGFFQSMGGTSANQIAQWNGSTWSALGSGVGADVFDLFTWGDYLIAGGNITSAGGVSVNGVAAWDGSSWSSLGDGVNGPNNPAVFSIAEYEGKLMVGGQFDIAGGIESLGNLAAWDGTYWQHIPKGTDDLITTSCVYNGDLVVAGEFTSIAHLDPRANRIALWDGSTWSELGSGLNGKVNAAIEYNGQLIAAGEFTEAGGTSANRIASWNGSSWSALGTGLNNTANALVVYNNDLYVGGTFTTAGGNSAARIAKWNGSSWSALGSGVNSEVLSLLVYNNLLIVGGGFDQAGGVNALNVASWNGSMWTNLAGGVTTPVRAMTVYKNKLAVEAWYQKWFGPPINQWQTVQGVRLWNGTSWSNLSKDLGSGAEVFSLKVYQDRLVACGSDLGGPSLSLDEIAVWGGGAWLPLGSGLNDYGMSLTEYNGSLVVSGPFRSAGAKETAYLALWNKPNFCCQGTRGNVDMSDNDNPDISDLSMLTSYLTDTPRPVLPCFAEADVDNSGLIDLSDWSLLNAYLTMTPRPTLPSCP